MKNCILIPARAGSKGVKNKNTRKFHEKSLVEYTICEALKISNKNDIYIASNDLNAIEKAKNYNINIDYIRPENISGSNSLMIELLKDFAKFIYNKNYDNIILLQPTSPLRDSNHILEALEIFEFNKEKRNINVLVSVTEVPHNYEPGSIYINTEEKYINNGNERSIQNRHLKKKYLSRNGPAILIVNIEYIIKSSYIYHDKISIYKMPKNVSIDIDDEYDFEIAEFLMKKKCT